MSVGLARTQFLLTQYLDQAHSRCFYPQIGQSDRAVVPVLIRDGARFHLLDGHADLPAKVRILTLPADSPELNPVESGGTSLPGGVVQPGVRDFGGSGSGAGGATARFLAGHAPDSTLDLRRAAGSSKYPP